VKKGKKKRRENVCEKLQGREWDLEERDRDRKREKRREGGKERAKEGERERDKRIQREDQWSKVDLIKSGVLMRNQKTRSLEVWVCGCVYVCVFVCHSV